jgi:hypothetical protein
VEYKHTNGLLLTRISSLGTTKLIPNDLLGFFLILI